MRQKSLLPNHPDSAESYINIASVYNNRGEYSKALSFYEKACKIQPRILPPNHPDLAIIYSNIAVAYDNNEKYLKALSIHEKSLFQTCHK